ncbi:MAG: cytochrome c [Acidiferrobacterales bacterium]
MKRILLALALVFSVHNAFADSMLLGDAKKGEAIHNAHCTACHTSTVYTRPNHMVKSIGGLVGRVNACSSNLGLNLSQDQVNDVVKYLNDTYYKFERS